MQMVFLFLEFSARFLFQSDYNNGMIVGMIWRYVYEIY